MWCIIFLMWISVYWYYIENFCICVLKRHLCVIFLAGEVFMWPGYWNNSDFIKIIRKWSFRRIISGILFQALLSFSISIKRLGVILMDLPLYMTWSYSLAGFTSFLYSVQSAFWLLCVMQSSGPICLAFHMSLVP